MLASNAGAIFPRNYRRRENMTIEAYAPLRDQPEHVESGRTSLRQETSEITLSALAAGRDIDPECDHSNNISGTTPLCWCITAGRLTKAHYQLATFLIENGCDVLKAHIGWDQIVGRGDRIGQEGPTLLDILRAQPRTTTNLRFTQYFEDKLARADILLSWAARFPPPPP